MFVAELRVEGVCLGLQRIAVVGRRILDPVAAAYHYHLDTSDARDIVEAQIATIEASWDEVCDAEGLPNSNATRSWELSSSTHTRLLAEVRGAGRGCEGESRHAMASRRRPTVGQANRTRLHRRSWGTRDRRQQRALRAGSDGTSPLRTPPANVCSNGSPRRLAEEGLRGRKIPDRLRGEHPWIRLSPDA